uniref:Uncharacterized protein n=1 Tax=Trichuris muris TaxID=70415 RepID=A0A5S6QRS7_TRIMR
MFERDKRDIIWKVLSRLPRVGQIVGHLSRPLDSADLAASRWVPCERAKWAHRRLPAFFPRPLCDPIDPTDEPGRWPPALWSLSPVPFARALYAAAALAGKAIGVLVQYSMWTTFRCGGSQARLVQPVDPNLC